MISFTTVGLVGLAVAWWKIGWFPTLLILFFGTCVAGVASAGQAGRDFFQMIDNAVGGSLAVGLVDHVHVLAAVFG